jgi:hypothetical protein
VAYENRFTGEGPGHSSSSSSERQQQQQQQHDFRMQPSTSRIRPPSCGKIH